MPTDTENPITSRRTTLGISLFAVASTLVPAAASANPDVQIIQACTALMRLEDEIMALFTQRLTIEDEQRTEPELTALYARQHVIEDRLSDMAPPATQAGAAALARVVTARWKTCGGDGTLLAADFDEWCAATVCEFVTSVTA